MQKSATPNDWTSNVAFVLLIPVVTAVTMRVRDSVCKRRQSLRTKYAVDLSYLLATNFVSFSSIVLWSYALSQSLVNVVALDLLFCVWIERWLYKVIASYDSTSYHPGASIGKFMIRQRMQLFCVLATVIRGYCSACTELFEDHFADIGEITYETQIVLVPALYAFVRTIALDIEAKQPRLVADEESITSSTFTITDEEEDVYQVSTDHDIEEQIQTNTNTNENGSSDETSMQVAQNSDRHMES